MISTPRKERAVIRELRRLVAEGAPLPLERTLVRLAIQIDQAVAEWSGLRQRGLPAADYYAACESAYREAADAVDAMARALRVPDRSGMGAGLERLAAAVARVDELVAQEPPPPTPPDPPRWLETVDSALARPVDADGALALVEMAEAVAGRGEGLRAFRLARKAAAVAAPEVAARARRVLGCLVAGYHLPMMNDDRRNAAWDRALRRAVRPGMRVLEIGTGAGMLALMAARAGAEKVVTCEYDPIVAEVAREMAARNGFADRIEVITASSLDLRMDEPADLLFCDNFADDMFSFQPLQSIADARRRLLKPGAPCLPAAAAVRLALADWASYPRFCEARRCCGFDALPAESFRCESMDLEIGDPGIAIRSAAVDAFRFDFSASEFPADESVALTLRPEGRVTGIAQWIRLELDDETILEARPEPGAVFFSNPRFHPLPSPWAGAEMRVRARHNGKALALWVEDAIETF